LDVSGTGGFTGSTTIGNTTISPNASSLGNVLVSNGTGAYWQATSTLGIIASNADTATALASDPTDCGVGEYATAIAANGNLTCSVPSGGGTGVGWATSSATQLYSTYDYVGIGT